MAIEEIIHCRCDGNGLTLDRPDEELAAHIRAGSVLVVPAWQAEQVLAYRRLARQWMAGRPPLDHGSSASIPAISFHRRDDEHCPTIIPHVFHQAALCHGTHDDPVLWAMTMTLIGALLALQNRLAGTDFQLSDPTLKVKIICHPVGGGHFACHVHPLEPMGVAFFLGLARPGSDFQDGGLFIEHFGRRTDLQQYLAPGNAVFFRYDLPHGVAAVDADTPRDWSGNTGVWLASVELTTSYPASRMV